ncbi:MAG: Bug family tripartite tricarboxylate transporter substrate binding protein [Xanthobacteraceae bacterium]
MISLSPVFMLAAFASMLWACGAARAQQPIDFKGETIGVNIGYPAGGAPDLYFRVLARHYGRHIPGKPVVVARNMPGAGTLRAANYIYNVAPRDGTELATFGSSAAMEPLMGNGQAKFEATKFTWIGSMNQEINFCGVWQTPGVATSFREMLTKETIFGASGPASFGYQHPLLLKNVFGAKVRLVTGYSGIPATYVAMQRGESNAMCGLVRTHIKTLWLSDVQEGRFKLVIQMGPRTTRALGDVPSVFDFIKTDEDRRILAFHFNQKLLGRPLAGPPNIPKGRASALRKAFQDTMRDSEFLADARKANLDIDPATSDEVEQLLHQFADYPADVIAKAKAAIGR